MEGNRPDLPGRLSFALHRTWHWAKKDGVTSGPRGRRRRRFGGRWRDRVVRQAVLLPAMGAECWAEASSGRAVVQVVVRRVSLEKEIVPRPAERKWPGRARATRFWRRVFRGRVSDGQRRRGGCWRSGGERGGGCGNIRKRTACVREVRAGGVGTVKTPQQASKQASIVGTAGNT